MTDELTKTFFDTFGIQPKWKSEQCDGWLRTTAVAYFTNLEEAKKFGIVFQEEPEYPQISDRILLELIKILSKEFIFKMFNNFDDDWALMLNTMGKDEQKWFVSCNGFKNALLSLLMNVCNCSDADNIKHQVRTLFEEG